MRYSRCLLVAGLSAVLCARCCLLFQAASRSEASAGARSRMNNDGKGSWDAMAARSAEGPNHTSASSRSFPTYVVYAQKMPRQRCVVARVLALGMACFFRA